MRPTSQSLICITLDVGGGSVINNTRHSLARIPLRWMIRECFKANTGIMFYAQGLQDLGLNPSTLCPIVTPRPPPLSMADATFLELPSLRKRMKAEMDTLSSTLKRKFRLSANAAAETTSPSMFEKPPAQDEHIGIGTEEEEDLKDALSPVYDQLKLQRAWWILEILPLKLRYQRGDNKWISYIG